MDVSPASSLLCCAEDPQYSKATACAQDCPQQEVSWRLRLCRCGAGHEVAAGGPSGADLRFVKREWARYEAMLGAVNDPTSLEAAVAKRAHKRLAEIAAEVKLTNSGVVELANQVRLQSPHPRCADHCDRMRVMPEHANSGMHGNAVTIHLDFRLSHPGGSKP